MTELKAKACAHESEGVASLRSGIRHWKGASFRERFPAFRAGEGKQEYRRVAEALELSVITIRCKIGILRV